MATGSVEERLGITEYMTQGRGINGVLKQRFRDFVVNEVDAEGRVVELTQPAVSFYRPAEKRSAIQFSLPEALRPLSEATLGSEGLSALDQLEESVLLGDIEKVVEFPCPEDKSARTRIHQFIKEHFPVLTSSTVFPI